MVKSTFGLLRALTERIPDGNGKPARDRAGAVDLDANGLWWRRAGQSGANLSFKLDSAHTAEVMRALDYTANLKARQSHFRSDLQQAPAAGGLRMGAGPWPNPPEYRERPAVAIEPGAGRVLGLLNFYALPRRLTLGLRRPRPGPGFRPARLPAASTLADGNARAEDLHIDGPSLKMDTRGRIGLVAKDYDQNVTISPDYSSGVTTSAPRCWAARRSRCWC